jgi:hypothetical protein
MRELKGNGNENFISEFWSAFEDIHNFRTFFDLFTICLIV